MSVPFPPAPSSRAGTILAIGYLLFIGLTPLQRRQPFFMKMQASGSSRSSFAWHYDGCVGLEESQHLPCLADGVQCLVGQPDIGGL